MPSRELIPNSGYDCDQIPYTAFSNQKKRTILGPTRSHHFSSCYLLVKRDNFTAPQNEEHQPAEHLFFFYYITSDLQFLMARTFQFVK